MVEASPPEASGDPPREEVVVVGGGPAGASAAIFTARYGLATLVFDRGASALDRCAYLANYPGFPAGIDVGAFQDLLHAHLDEAGAELVTETVVSVQRSDDGNRFVVESDAGRVVETDRVLAAAWYDGSYLESLGEPAMFEEQEHHGELEERFDSDYADADGRTPVEGLYVASPAGGRSAQAVVAAGNGAHVARSVIEDHRREEGFAGEVAREYDWTRRDAEFSGEWADRDRWREWFENELPADHGGDDERVVELRERYIDRAFETRTSEQEAADRYDDGLERLVEVLGQRRVLAAVDDDVIREYATGEVVVDDE